VQPDYECNANESCSGKFLFLRDPKHINSVALEQVAMAATQRDACERIAIFRENWL
jgi:hypothetical protein